MEKPPFEIIAIADVKTLSFIIEKVYQDNSKLRIQVAPMSARKFEECLWYKQGDWRMYLLIYPCNCKIVQTPNI